MKERLTNSSVIALLELGIPCLSFTGFATELIFGTNTGNVVLRAITSQ